MKALYAFTPVLCLYFMRLHLSNRQRDDDGDGCHEVRVNTLKGDWSLPMTADVVAASPGHLTW